MRNLFKSLDLFGTNFNFKINQNQLVKSTFGGILSICLILLSITFIFLFGKDCFFRQSSRLLFENVIINDPLNKTINNDNFTIGFMTISDGRGIPIPDYLDVRIAYYRHFLNKSSEFGEYQYFTTVLEWDLCSKIKGINPLYLLEINTKFLSNCVNLNTDSYKLGGYWGDNIFSYIELSIQINRRTNLTISDIDMKLRLESIDFVIFYPDYILQPNDLDKPLKYNFRLSSQKLVVNKSTLNEMFFTLVKLKDDLGWIIQDIHEKEIITLQRNNQLIDVRTNEYYSIYNNTSLANYDFFILSNYLQINRSFMKIQEVLAQVGGFMKSIMVIFYFLGHLINKFHIEYILIDTLFDYFDNSEFITIKKAKIFGKHNNNTYNASVSSITDKKNQNNENSIFLENNSFVPDQYYQFSNFRIEKLTTYLQKEMNELKSVRENQKPKINICFNIKHLLKTNVKPATPGENFLLLGKEYIYSKLDLSYYMNLCVKFEHLLAVIFNAEQYKLFQLENKPNLFLEPIKADSENNELLNIKLIEYFSKKCEENQLTELDQNLIDKSNIIFRKYFKQ